MRRPLRKLALLGTSCAVGVGLLVPSALAGDTKPPPPTKKKGKVTICHKTGSAKNPIEVISVSRHALKAHLHNHHDGFFVKKDKRKGKCVFLKKKPHAVA